MRTNFVLSAIILGLVAVAPAWAEDKKPIHPDADRLLRETSDKLKEAKAFSVKAEVWEDVVVAGHKVTTTKRVEVKLRRPDGLQVEVRSPLRSRGFWYDGKTLTLLNRKDNLYGTVETPDTIDKLLEAANEKFGVSFPLEDLLVSDPYATAMEDVKGGASFGKVELMGTACKHIAFSTERADWQLWIAVDTGLPKKLAITYKKEETQPQVTALFSDWDLKGNFSDKTFAFVAPQGAAKIKILPAQDQGE